MISDDGDKFLSVSCAHCDRQIVAEPCCGSSLGHQAMDQQGRIIGGISSTHAVMNLGVAFQKLNQTLNWDAVFTNKPENLSPKFHGSAWPGPFFDEPVRVARIIWQNSA